MQIILERVPKLGQMGEVVNVKPGYAATSIPHGKALRATKASIGDFEKRRAQLRRTISSASRTQAMAAKVDGQMVTLPRQASETSQLYGSVNLRDVAWRSPRPGSRWSASRSAWSSR